MWQAEDERQSVGISNMNDNQHQWSIYGIVSRNSVANKYAVAHKVGMKYVFPSVMVRNKHHAGTHFTWVNGTPNGSDCRCIEVGINGGFCRGISQTLVRQCLGLNGMAHGGTNSSLFFFPVQLNLKLNIDQQRTVSVYRTVESVSRLLLGMYCEAGGLGCKSHLILFITRRSCIESFKNSAHFSKGWIIVTTN